MKQLFLGFMLMFACCLTGYTQSSQALQLNKEGKLKIVQLTDLHYIAGNADADFALAGIDTLLDFEKPDLIILTGDVISGKPADTSIRTVLDKISAKKKPFILLFGNHDDESGLSRSQLFDIVQSYPYNITYTTEGISGVGNCIFTVKGKTGKDEFVLYCFDSNAYSGITKGYDHIKFDQIAWYREKSAAFTAQNGNTPVPSLAFFHIPLSEYNLAASDENTALFGTRLEKACSPPFNSGLFTSIKEMGDIMGTFVGHDHDCDYVTLWYGVALAYGRFSGGNSTYNNLKPNGCRVIELTEGEKGFKTWIRLRNGNIINVVNCPDGLSKTN
jgi:3',5'-cyclic AMP phosphodiesterase CpdA